MSHEFESGVFFKEPAWHGLGNVTYQPMTKGEILPFAGLDWKVKTQACYTYLHDKYTEVPNKAVVRQSDMSVLGVVGPSYTPLQNSEVLEWFEPFLDSNRVQIVTAGSLYSGKKIWMLGEIQTPDLEVSSNDSVRAFLLFSHSHDGTMACRVGFTPIRVVCANTLAMAHNSVDSKLVRIRHTTRVKRNLEIVRDTLDLVEQEFRATVDQYKLLATKGIAPTDVRKYVKMCLGFEIEDRDLSTRATNIIDKCVRCVYSSPGSDLSLGTYWQAYNGVNYYLNYVYGNSVERRLDGIWFGQLAKMNQDALHTALQLAS